MLRNRYVILGGILGLLIVANLIRYIILDWGLVTVRVTDAPLGQVIKSIERQGWVKIYTNMDLNTRVSMFCEKVPVAEAMETLVANVPSEPTSPSTSGQGSAGSQHHSFGGGAEWKLAFFAGPNSAEVKKEILSFESNTLGDDTKVYSYPTSLDLLDSGSDDDMAGLPASDPRRQAWAGYKAPTPRVVPASGDASDSSTNPPPAPPPAPTTISDYLQAMAEQSDILVIAPSSWDTTVPGPPAANSSIITAVRNLVDSARGSVQTAIILRARGHHDHSTHGSGGGFAGDTGWSYMEDRVRSAISGMPADAQPQALASLNNEVAFQQTIRAAPPDQRMALMRDHFMKHHGDTSWRRSPEKRAEMYARAVSNREAARGQ